MEQDAPWQALSPVIWPSDKAFPGRVRWQRRPYSRGFPTDKMMLQVIVSLTRPSDECSVANFDAARNFLLPELCCELLFQPSHCFCHDTWPDAKGLLDAVLFADGISGQTSGPSLTFPQCPHHFKAFGLDISLVNPPAIRHRPASLPPQPAFHFRSIVLNPAIDRRMIDADTPLR